MAKKKVSEQNEAQACMKEIEATLEKYNCVLGVKFEQTSVLGQSALMYAPIVIMRDGKVKDKS